MVDKAKRAKQIRDICDRIGPTIDFKITAKTAIGNYIDYINELEDCHHLTEKQALQLIEKNMIINALIFDEAFKMGLDKGDDDAL